MQGGGVTGGERMSQAEAMAWVGKDAEAGKDEMTVGTSWDGWEYHAW